MYVYIYLRKPEVSVRCLPLLLSTLIFEICFLSELKPPQLGQAGRLENLGHLPVYSPAALGSHITNRDISQVQVLVSAPAIVNHFQKYLTHSSQIQ